MFVCVTHQVRYLFPPDVLHVELLGHIDRSNFMTPFINLLIIIFKFINFHLFQIFHSLTLSKTSKIFIILRHPNSGVITIELC